MKVSAEWMQMFVQALQKILQQCQEAVGLSGFPLDTNDKVAGIVQALAALMPEHFGIREDEFRERRDMQGIFFKNLFQGESVSVGLFILAADVRIPLHNHPHMTVVSRLLAGKMVIDSYDWVAYEGERRIARRTLSDCFQGPCALPTIFPEDGGNVHTIHTLEPSAFLDVVLPPYDPEQGRPCLYFNVAESIDPPTIPARLLSEFGDCLKRLGLLQLARHQALRTTSSCGNSCGGAAAGTSDGGGDVVMGDSPVRHSSAGSASEEWSGAEGSLAPHHPPCSDSQFLRLPDGAEGKDEDMEDCTMKDRDTARDPPCLQVGYHNVRQALLGQYSEQEVFVLLERCEEDEFPS